MLLDAILWDATQNLQPLRLAVLDVSKAFDSVNHGAVLNAAARMGAPPPLLRYIAQSYDGCVTYLDCSRDLPILMTRGVKQGEPLSPILCNSVLDGVLRNIPDGVETKLGETSVPALAFADDLVLCARTSCGLRRSLDALQTCLSAAGLVLNVEKSATLAITIDAKAKRYVVDTSEVFRLGQRNLSVLDAESQLKYLGIQFQPHGAAPSDGSILEEGLRNLRRASIKPQQRMFMLRDHLVPKLQHGLVLGAARRGTLRKLDVQMRHHVRLWLRLLKDTPVAYLHARSADGGLGLPQFSVTIPILREKRMRGLEQSDSSSVRGSLERNWAMW